MSELLRVATAGSVDDGKSTLIGRLLYDSKAIFDDQWDAVERTSRARGGDDVDLALLTDGLRAEREQGITIDVAYRYFSTPKRKFVVADTPGHVQYTRNMVTGASTADLALILVDARAGVLQQTRRHAFLASLLGVAHLVLCVNKMDLVDWSEDRFEEIKADFSSFATKLDVHDLTFVPMCALGGDNVVHRTESMPWYTGGSLMHVLEEVHVASDRNLIDARFPVQYVIRPKDDGEHRDFRGLAGTVAGGVFAPGDEIVVLPSGFRTRISAVWGPGGAKITEGFASSAVCLELDDPLDVGRGDMLCRPNNRPDIGTDIDAMVCWLAEGAELRPEDRYLMLHTSNSTIAHVTRLDYRLDVDTLHRDRSAESLSLNDIGRVRIRTQNPLFFDPYRRNRVTGSFLLVNESTGATVAAGMIGGPALTASNVVWHAARVERESRATRGATVWLTGLSASGKSTIAAELERILVASGRPAYRLDGDNLRHGLNSDLGFDRTSRAENVRRVGEVAGLMADAGLVAIACLISPYRTDRDDARRVHDRAGLRFFEVHVDTPLEVCAQRDPKGMYAKARAGEITGFTGVDDPYEAPEHPDLVLRPSDGDPAAQALRIVELLSA
ncbi:adenylyl-sulfate kinase [Rhodococcus sp. BP-252]|uniref:adenylyl-sulfate kinase n=1 Tax=unclassified Rhodococcus (in: high G+C Gram-positive bacteria) TaxID=192944 RepID=UPI001C9A69F1|nr:MULTISPECIES: adenylyl-sulfate kinase [unclassified Rhodococcus (in: high G+C Gram-positive bacteria)]MBY6414001.1 adenylyl-sulfate kinase [Rhodococcus sp. BP-320]MBY6418766.1 adenylyl-sulfate kinase [Rhodococcus sp. BP-321]MBY6423353.1 adenylyl-sulfate kinase [Rhodococcus sp. BP-324]MBY6428801.1 adenylyl-sulfate kinase [Rhodococcus sp. BP-323]MBY6433807.1 adenylyl-sulfate kinase [Rhodococcus sp. BP-322]